MYVASFMTKKSNEILKHRSDSFSAGTPLLFWLKKRSLSAAKHTEEILFRFLYSTNSDQYGGLDTQTGGHSSNP